jgi:hypothetical protein
MSRLVGIFDSSLLESGRTVAWVSALGVALLAGLITGLGIPKKRGNLLGGLIAALLVFNLPHIDWVPNMRVDVTAIFFTLVGMFIFLKYPRGLGLAAATAAFVAAIFTKQTMLAAPGAAFLGLLLAKRRREAILMVAIGVTLGGGVAAFLWVATHGEFLRHTMSYNVNLFSVKQLFKFGEANLSGLNALAGLAFAMCLVILNDRYFYRVRESLDETMTVRRVMLLYFIASFIVSLTAGKIGASTNYFLEWNVVCCILAGFLLSRVHRSSWPRSATGVVIVLMIAIFAFSRVRETRHRWNILWGRDQNMHQLAIDARRALDLIQRTPGPVLSEDMTLLMLAGKDVPWEPAIVTVLADQGLWNEAPALEMIKNQKFELIIAQDLNNPLLFSEGVRTMIKNHYVDSGQGSWRYTVFRPR